MTETFRMLGEVPNVDIHVRVQQKQYVLQVCAACEETLTQVFSVTNRKLVFALTMWFIEGLQIETFQFARR